MSTLQNKIDFAVIFRVTNANPNGDPLNGNRPRTDYANFGEVTDVAIKRKIRDRLLEAWVANGKQEDGNKIYVQSDDRRTDDCRSLRERFEKELGKDAGGPKTAELACQKWLDVRAFGQLFALKATAAKKNSKKTEEDGDTQGDTGVSIGIRGPVTVQSAFSVEPIDVTSTQITKSVSGEGDGTKRGSDTMGMKHRVDRGVYKFFGSMNPQLAEKTNFSDIDAATIKAVLPRLFENDESSARPAGSMQVLAVIWWQHNCKSGQYSSARVHGSLKVNSDGSYTLESLNDLQPECLNGF
ncbi:CRISPR-associated protein Csd2 [Vitreoscilla filiformis]|uniref:CRISPR-associated protein Csd2 n=1 Tax=Vitreoscilla filiformis TaxID=63 RepID=A0A221KGH6_VITFI|nr:type I-C CRISPR-associated protein Cas7/Csd2 [Vitreoscilla filiformis]ASM78152.1 CRISPR-associated protein Csd2 [Vitreoscilla filiformis]